MFASPVTLFFAKVAVERDKLNSFFFPRVDICNFPRLRSKTLCSYWVVLWFENLSTKLTGMGMHLTHWPFGPCWQYFGSLGTLIHPSCLANSISTASIFCSSFSCCFELPWLAPLVEVVEFMSTKSISPWLIKSMKVGMNKKNCKRIAKLECTVFLIEKMFWIHQGRR